MLCVMTERHVTESPAGQAPEGPAHTRLHRPAPTLTASVGAEYATDTHGEQHVHAYIGDDTHTLTIPDAELLLAVLYDEPTRVLHIHGRCYRLTPDAWSDLTETVEEAIDAANADAQDTIDNAPVRAFHHYWEGHLP